jgi:Carboxypeptidase regulatory-like domain
MKFILTCLSKGRYFLPIITLAAIGFVFFAVEDGVRADSNYFALTTVTPFSQNWTTTSLITVNDDWSGVPSINGFRGDGLTAGTGVDPQTVLVADSPGVIDVNANQTNPNTFATGGVTEFDGIANPTVAIFGSGTGRAPYIDIRLNTTGCADPSNRVNVAYNLRDIDGSTDNSVQPAALHYRVGNAGAYTNVPAGFVADASTGPSLATLVTPVSVALPVDSLGQAQVHVRIMTTDAVGNDEAIGVDDINVTCSTVSAANATLGGRVRTAGGGGVSKARVEISGDSLSGPRYALTNPFGYYSFPDLQTGQSYSVSVSAKDRIFAQATRIVTLGDDLADVDFTTIE